MHQLACLAVVGRPEAKRVHRRDRTRAHREDVPQDAAHASRRTLIGFDVGRVVVAFHFEDQRLAVADINDARILARAADHLRAFGRQGTQPFLRRFVGTVFVPHGRKDAQFGKGGFAPDDIQNTLIFFGVDAVAGNQVLGDGWFGHGARFPLAICHTS